MKNITLDTYLDSFKQTTDFPSLDGTLYLLNSLDNPHKKLKFIHVAGTNGKGSIVEMLNNILINSNLKVGKFISPHLIRANESICINNTQIDNSSLPFYINKFTEVEKEFIKKYNRTFTRFEIITALAIDYFYKNNTDIVILEVGLGGLFDCTNVITPIVSVFGSISFDHTQILGNSLEEIAIQKGGIIKENSKSVIFNQEATKYIQKIADEKNNTLKVIYENEISNYSFDKDYQYFEYENIKYIHSKGLKFSECNLAMGIDWSSEENIFILKTQLEQLLDFYIDNPELEPAHIINMNVGGCENNKEILKICGAGEITSINTDGKNYPCNYINPMCFKDEELKELMNLDFEKLEEMVKR